MKYRGPVITLLAVAAVAAVLFAVNIRTVAETAARSSTSPATGPPATAPPATAPPATAPPATAPPAPPPAAPAQAKYAGRTSGNEATIAISVDGGAASAYVCDGKRIESWLKGTVAGGRLSLQGKDDAQVTGTVQDGAVFGTMQVQGKQWPYSAQSAQAPAGLYGATGTVNGAPARVGWIVRQDGSQVGVANVGGVRRPAPALDPRRLSGVELGGSVIIPRPVGGGDDVSAPS